MKLLKTVPFILLVLAIASCAQHPDNFTKYAGDGFEIYYPQDWDATPGAGEVALVLSAPLPPEMMQHLRPEVRISFGTNDKGGKKLMDASAEILSSAIPSYREIRRETKLLSGNDGNLVYEGKISAYDTVWDIRFFEGSPDFFVSGMCEKQDYPGLRETFAQIAKSFKRR